MAKITDNSNELSFHQLTSTSSVLLIPLFQRAYVWTQKQFDRMTSEIEAIESGQDASRFLGAVIAVTRPTNPSQPTPHEIVDGQQRLTTLYMFLVAAAHVAAREGRNEYARGLISTNLIVDWAQDIPVNTKLQPSIADRGQFQEIFARLSGAGTLSDWVPVKAKLPHRSGSNTGPLFRQYNRIQNYLQKKASTAGFDAVERLVEVVRNSMTFVFILLKDPGSATTVFEGLNDPGIPIAVGDLVKNEVFAKIGYDEPTAVYLHDAKWLPFRDKFSDAFNDYFFPFSVLHRPSTSRTEMFGELRNLWKDLDAEQIIKNLDEYSEPFLTIHGIYDPASLYGAEIGTSVQRLVDLKRPASVYPFIMQLLKQLADSKIRRTDASACLEVLESFLVRRALCGIEPTGLLGLFRTMWTNVGGHPNGENVAETILKRLTVEWPTDGRLREAIKTRPLYGASIAKFVILEFDKYQGMDQPTISSASIEHIMPRNYCESWANVVNRVEHAKLKNLWANLIPLSTVMNTNVDQLPFDAKRDIFSNESMFVSARRFADDYGSWGPDEISARSEALANWAVTRWHRPILSEA